MGIVSRFIEGKPVNAGASNSAPRRALDVLSRLDYHPFEKDMSREFEARPRVIPFLITVYYLASLLSIRVLVYLAGSAHTQFAQAAKMGLTPDTKFYIGRNIILFGYHIHHFYIGIALICIAGWLSIVGSSALSRKRLAVLYGTGLGLFMDEIGLLLTWGDYYSGLSYLLSLFLVGLFLNIIFFPDFWKAVKANIGSPDSHSIIRGAVLKNAPIVRFMDTVASRMGKTEPTSLLMIGILSIAVGVLVLIFPRFLRYWIFGAFVVQGLAHFVSVRNSDSDGGDNQ